MQQYNYIEPHEHVIDCRLKKTRAGRKNPAGFFYPFISAVHTPFRAFHP